MSEMEGFDREFLSEHVRCNCAIRIDADHSQLAETLEELIQKSVNSNRDWKTAVASELVEQFVETSLGNHIWSSPQDTDSPSRLTLVSAMNLALTQIVGTASLACDIARNLEGSPQSDETSSLPSFTRLNPENGSGEPAYAIADILTHLTVILLRALEARDDYRYSHLVGILDQIDEMPMEFKSDRFRVFSCLRIVALAGQSRTKKTESIRESIHIDIWKKLSADIRRDSLLVHESDDEPGLHECMAHPMLILISAIGHMRREHAAALVPELVAIVFADLDKLDHCWPANHMSYVVRATRHHLEYYRYFAYHVLAIAIADRYSNIADRDPDREWITSLEHLLGDRLGNVDPSDWHDMASDAYRRATTAIENALNLVPRTNDARLTYYDLTSENLEHEMSLRLELLKQTALMEDRVEQRAKDHVAKAMEDAEQGFEKNLKERERNLEQRAEVLQAEVRNISIRVVEIIGIFLAIVAFLGTAVWSAGAEELEVRYRILILVSAGVVSLLYFVLLRWVVLRPISSTIGSKSHPPNDGSQEKQQQESD